MDGNKPVSGDTQASETGPRVFLFGVGKDKLEAAVSTTGVTAEVVNELRRADVVLTTKTHYRRGSQLVRVAEATGKPVYVLRKNTMLQVEDFLKTLAREGGREAAETLVVLRAMKTIPKRYWSERCKRLKRPPTEC